MEIQVTKSTNHETLKFRLDGLTLVWPGPWICLVCGAAPSRARRLRYRNVPAASSADGLLEFDAPLCTPHLEAFDRTRVQSRASLGLFALALGTVGLLPLLSIPPWILVLLALVLAVLGVRLRSLGRRPVLPFHARLDASRDLVLEYPGKAPLVPAASAPAENTTHKSNTPEPERTTEDGGCWDEVGLPDLFRGVSDGHELAFSALQDEVFHQGGITSHTAQAIPELVRLAGQPSLKLRSEVLWLLAVCAGNTLGKAEGIWRESRSGAEGATRRALLEHVDALTSLLGDPDQNVRRAAALILAAGQLLPGALRSQVRARFDQESDSPVKAGLLLTLHPIPATEWDYVVGVFRSASDPLVRWISATMIVKTGRADTPTDVKEHLRSGVHGQQLLLWAQLDPDEVALYTTLEDFLDLPDGEIADQK